MGEILETGRGKKKEEGRLLVQRSQGERKGRARFTFTSPFGK